MGSLTLHHSLSKRYVGISDGSRTGLGRRRQEAEERPVQFDRPNSPSPIFMTFLMYFGDV